MTRQGLDVAIMGQPGAYHDQIASHYFGDMYQPVHTRSFEEVFDAVKGGDAAFGVTAIANSSVGSIKPIYELLREHAGEVSIVGEAYLGIHHSLLAIPGASIEDIDQVSSHPMALAQCGRFLQRSLPWADIVHVSDTAAAAKAVAERGRINEAAIAGAENAERYGLASIKSFIEDDQTNQTRFLVLQKSDDVIGGFGNKASFLLEGVVGESNSGKPNSLQVIGGLAAVSAGITQIETLPVAGKPWTPDIFVDVVIGRPEVDGEILRYILDDAGVRVRELGVYLRGAFYDGPPATSK